LLSDVLSFFPNMAEQQQPVETKPDQSVCSMNLFSLYTLPVISLLAKFTGEKIESGPDVGDESQVGEKE
jgi:hypothetical protein